MHSFNKFKNQIGLSLVEIILAIALFGLVSVPLILILINSYGSNLQAEEREIAVLYAQQGIEAVKSIRRQAWNLLDNGNYGLTNVNGYWQFLGSSDLLENKYTRTITISDACRDSGNNLVDCPNVLVDFHAKKIISSVDYNSINGFNNVVNLVSYVTIWQSKDWVQTDWSGALGQTQWFDQSKYFSDDGNIDYSTSGEIKLKSLEGGGGCGVKIWIFDNSADYTYDPNKIEVTGGFAQLKGTSFCSGTPTSCGNLASQISCQAQAGCSWDQPPGNCQNNGSCTAVSRNECNTCNLAGCSRSGNKCTGTLNCSAYTSQAACGTCNQCLWSQQPGSCLGTPTPCGNLTDQTSCQTQTGCSWTGNYPADQPDIYPVASFSVPQIDAWTSFTEVATKNGGEIYYQLSDGTTWYWYDGSNWAPANTDPGTTDYNLASVISTNINSFPVSSQEIKFKAFFQSDGLQQVQLDEVKISCSQYYDWPFTANADYTYDPNKIEVTGGFAQLKGTAFCSGTPNPCSNFTSQTSCQTQAGCSWDQPPGNCQNNGSCTAVSRNECNTCNLAGCSRSGNKCTGTLNCSAYTSQAACGTCNQCLWSQQPGSCLGTPTPCGNLTDQTSCQTQTGCSWTGNYPADQPDIYPVASFSVPQIDAWTSFTEVATKNGGEIYYQLSDNEGSSWKFTNGIVWLPVTGSTDYNTASEINSSILAFPTTTAKIMFKAFLSSDGSQQVQLDNVTIGFGEAVGISGYTTAGWLESSAFNTGWFSSFNFLSWTETIPSAAYDIQIQISTAPDNAGVPGIWSDWLGPSGSGSFYLSGDEIIIPIFNNHNDSQWVKYKIFMSGDGIDTPILQDIKINYTP